MKRFSPFRLDTVNQCLWRDTSKGEERLLLAPTAYAILRYLVEHAGRLVTHDELLDAVWRGAHVQPQAIKRHMLEVRNALGDNPKNPVFIETLPRRGYQFIAPVSDGELKASRVTVASGPGRLHGRERALAQLQECLLRASIGQRQVVFVTGEPGIGKTALIDEFERQTASNILSTRVARGQCIEGYGGKEAYYPILQALGALCSGSGKERVVQILAAQAPTWLVQFPALVKPAQREFLQRELLGATRERMLREIGEALDTITRESALLLVLEDLQWVDPSTVDLISSVARGRGAAKLMLIGTYRTVDVALSDQPLKTVKQDLLVHRLCHEIALDPLDEVAVAEYLAAGSREGSLPNGLAALLHRQAGGNPLFMIAALELMQERNLVLRRDQGWQIQVPLEEIELEVPENLRQMIEAQIERLAPEEQRALEVASVAGAAFDVGVSAEVGGLDLDGFQEICQTVSRRHRMIRAAAGREFPDGIASPRYEFVHALYHEVFYQRIAPGRKAKLHQRIGELLEVSFRNHLSQAAGELAHHFEQGADWPRAVKYLRLSAETAARRFAHRETAGALQRSLELLNKLPGDNAACEIDILAELASVYAVSFETLARAVETYETLASLAAHHGRMDDELRALVDMAYPLAWINPPRCAEVVERAVALGGRGEDTLQRAQSQASDLVQQMASAASSVRAAEECRAAFADVRAAGDRLVLACLLSGHSMVECDPLDCWAAVTFTSQRGRCRYMHLLCAGEWTETLREVNAARTAVRSNPDCDHLLTLQLCEAWVHLSALDFAGVVALCEPILALPDGNVRSATRRFGQVLAGSAETSLGNHERALQYLLAAERDMDRHMVIWDWYWRMALESAFTETWLSAGDLTKARAHGERFINVSLASADPTWQALAWEANAQVGLAEGNLRSAQDCIVKAVATVENFDAPLAGWRVHATAARLHQRTGNTMLAQRFQELSLSIISKLATGLEEPLRQSFLSRTSARKTMTV